MENLISDYFNRFSFLQLEDLKMIYSLIRIRRINKGEIILKSGEISNHIFVVLKGLLRAYTLTSDGDEITLAFALEGMEIGNPHCVFALEPSKATIEALEPSFIIILDSARFEILANKYHRLTLFQTAGLKKYTLRLTERIYFYTVLTAEERYIYIQQHQPELIQRVPQKYLASYIGVTTVSLSRIKARLANPKKSPG